MRLTIRSHEDRRWLPAVPRSCWRAVVLLLSVVLTAYPSRTGLVAPPAVKWHPGHYVLVGNGPISSDLLFEHFRGVQKRYTWSDLEPAKGRYDFTEIHADLALLESNGNVWLHESHTPHVPTPESMEKWKHLAEQKQVYSAVITDGDNAVGLILDALKREGLADNTIVMFSSDNGPEWTHADQQHKKMGAGYGSWASIGQTGGLRGKKRSLYEGGVRVPLIVRWPGHTPAGMTNTTTVLTAVDLLPTLCAAAAVNLPADYQGDGENLLPALQGKAITRTRPVFWEWRGPKPEPDWWPRFAVRDGDWKLLMTEDAQRVELHNLKTDRAEEAGQDLSQAHPEIVARLTKMTLDWKVTLPAKIDPQLRQPEARRGLNVREEGASRRVIQ